MINTWQQLSLSERIASAQAVASKMDIDECAVEKDWWVCVVLKALFNTEAGGYLLFKGGTSLSKGWKLINRFSEDIDLSIGREFFATKGCRCAHPENNTQLKNLRKFSRDYIHETLSKQLGQELTRMGVAGFTIKNQTEEATEAGLMKISHDSDPTVIFVEYDSVFPNHADNIQQRIKVEVSCLAMSEPFEVKGISSLIHEQFSEVDEDLSMNIRLVTPSRTFLEKVFLLNEEFQKEEPRSLRMSRHMYDLERIISTTYCTEALQDTRLYAEVVEHRRKYYHLGYVNYDLDYPPHISIIPEGKTLEAYRRDYEDNMVDGYIYGKAIPFNDLIERLKTLQNQIRSIAVSKSDILS